MDWRTILHANGLLTIFQECLHMYYTWIIVRKPFAYIVILQSMWTGPEHGIFKGISILHGQR